jgi:hypothetical protein
MKVSRVAAVVTSSDYETSVKNLTALLGGPLTVFPVPVADLMVTMFSGMSLVSGSRAALEPVRDLRATMFVDSLIEAETLTNGLGWTRAGSLGAASLLLRAPDGNLLEIIESERQDTHD